MPLFKGHSWDGLCCSFRPPISGLIPIMINNDIIPVTERTITDQKPAFGLDFPSSKDNSKKDYGVVVEHRSPLRFPL